MELSDMKSTGDFKNDFSERDEEIIYKRLCAFDKKITKLFDESNIEKAVVIFKSRYESKGFGTNLYHNVRDGDALGLLTSAILRTIQNTLDSDNYNEGSRLWAIAAAEKIKNKLDDMTKALGE